MYSEKPTISQEVLAMAEALETVVNNDLLYTACPLTICLFATYWVWTCRDITEFYLWPSEDLMGLKHGDSQ